MKLGDKEIALVKTLRWSGKSWEDVREELLNVGVQIRRNNLIKQCQQLGSVPKMGGMDYEAWCAPKRSMKKAARRMRTYRARKRAGLVGVVPKAIVSKAKSVVMPPASLVPEVTHGLGLPADLAGSSPVPAHSVQTEVRSIQPPPAPRLDGPVGQGEPVKPGVVQVEKPPVSRPPELVPAETSLAGVVTNEAVKATKETASVEGNTPVFHVPVSMPEKVAREIPGVPVENNTSEPTPGVNPNVTAVVTSPEAVVPKPGSRLGLVIGDDGVERPETVLERRARCDKIAKDSADQIEREAREKAKWAEWDKADKADTQMRCEKVANQPLIVRYEVRVSKPTTPLTS